MIFLDNLWKFHIVFNYNPWKFHSLFFQYPWKFVRNMLEIQNFAISPKEISAAAQQNVIKDLYKVASSSQLDNNILLQYFQHLTILLLLMPCSLLGTAGQKHFLKAVNLVAVMTKHVEVWRALSISRHHFVKCSTEVNSELVLSLPLSVCLSVYLSACLSLSVSQSVCLSVCLSVIQLNNGFF